jgi:alpha-beta hydrolase superfamily lysophospholipase
MGGSPDAYPERYALADPITHVPLAIPVLLVHGSEDLSVSVRRSRNYAAAARAAGGEVDLVELAGAEGSHRRHVDPDSLAWASVVRWLEGPASAQLRGSPGSPSDARELPATDPARRAAQVPRARRG